MDTFFLLTLVLLLVLTTAYASHEQSNLKRTDFLTKDPNDTTIHIRDILEEDPPQNPIKPKVETKTPPRKIPPAVRKTYYCCGLWRRG